MTLLNVDIGVGLHAVVDIITHLNSSAPTGMMPNSSIEIRVMRDDCDFSIMHVWEIIRKTSYCSLGKNCFGKHCSKTCLHSLVGYAK